MFECLLDKTAITGTDDSGCWFQRQIKREKACF
jgi:hypothetical protein